MVPGFAAPPPTDRRCRLKPQVISCGTPGHGQVELCGLQDLLQVSPKSVFNID